jgi:glycosyltransferase involved in cell wall biosynthesis
LNGLEETHRPLVLLFDTDARGHLPFHAEAFARAALQKTYGFDVVLCMPSAVLDRLSQEVVRGFGPSSQVRFHALTDEQIASCNSPNSLARGVRKWRLGRELARWYGASHVFYFVLDVVLAGALLDASCFRPPQSFSGILFRPRLHLEGQPAGFSERLKRARQLPYYGASLALPHLTDVWTLDPFFVPYARKSLPGGQKVKFIGEAQILPKPGRKITATPRSSRTRFLMYGLLKERKGVLVLLQALRTFTPADWAGMEVALLGEFEPSIREKALALAAEIRQAPGSNLIFTPEYIADELIVEEVQRADVLLVNYLNHIGSSGVVFAAALAGKPVITQRTGLLAKLIETYGLGVTIDTFDPNALGNELRRLSDPAQVQAAFDPFRARQYVESNRPGFAYDILSTIETRLHAAS